MNTFFEKVLDCFRDNVSAIFRGECWFLNNGIQEWLDFAVRSQNHDAKKVVSFDRARVDGKGNAGHIRESRKHTVVHLG
jgi:hypothetical protein